MQCLLNGKECPSSASDNGNGFLVNTTHPLGLDVKCDALAFGFFTAKGPKQHYGLLR